MNNKRGQSLMAMYMVVLVLSVLGGSFLTKGVAVNKIGDLQRLESETFYLAQGGLEDGVSRFITAISNFQIDPNVTCYPDTNGDGACNPDVNTQTDVLVTAICAKSAACPDSPYPAGSNPRVFMWVREAEAAQRTIIDPDGTSIFVKNYEIVSRAVHPLSASMSTTLHQVVTRRIIYTFQHAVFYQDDLEFLPGPNATLSGRVHSNHDMYLGSNALLTLDTSYVHSAGKIYNQRKDTTGSMSGNVQIKKLGTSTFALMSGLDSDIGTWEADSQTRWLGTVKSDVHGIKTLAVPTVGTTQPGGYYDQQAQLKIINGTVQLPNGTILVEGSDIPVGTVTTTTTLYNNREGKYVKTSNVDLKKLGGYYDVNSDGILDPPGTPGNPFTSKLPSNGLIYATRNDAGSYQPGIRLKDASLINRAAGLTIVSDDPVYVQGDYNTVSKKPVAIIADALNLLSNNWNDTNSAGALSGRTASNTTFNSAFIAGIKTTAGASYNGGLENYPRLHENWTSKTLTIRGAFVALWNSQIGTGNWIYGGNYYTAPTRNWDYDTDFTNGQMPPFTPWAVEAVRGAWWKQ